MNIEQTPHAPGRRACRRTVRTLALLGLAVAGSGVSAAADTVAAAAPLPVKVMIVNMFQLEAAPWLEALRSDHEILVPGLTSDFPTVHCNPDGVCQMTTGMGHANAAASLMAVIYSGQFDLRQAYFLIAGIAGIDPGHGTIGTAAWARYAVDVGIAHEIDPREMPKGWHDGYLGMMTDSPDQVPAFDYRTEMFRLDEALLKRAFALSQAAVLEDSDDVRAYRAHYHSAPANERPRVVQCDTVSGDTWFVGRRLGDRAARWMRLLTQGAGDYCTTQQEDNATLNALSRGSQSGLVDLKRVAILRSGSDFDRPYAHQDVFGGLRAQLKLDGSVRIAANNLVKAGMPLVEAIVGHWDLWRDGTPAAPAP